MKSNEDFRRQLMATFQAELQDHLRTLNQGVLALEKAAGQEPDSAIIEEMFRVAHSLKGASRAVELADLELVSHRLEDALSALRQGMLLVDPNLADLLFRALDILREGMEAHLQGAPLPETRYRPLLEDLETAAKGESLAPRPKQKPVETPEKPSEPPVAGPAADGGTKPSEPVESAREERPAVTGGGLAAKDETVRVATSKLDALMEDMVELLVARMRPAHSLQELKALDASLASWQAQWRQVRGQYHRIRRKAPEEPGAIALLDFLGLCEKNLHSLREATSQLVKSVARDTRQLNQLTDEMQLNVLHVRMLPMSDLFHMFPRMVRDMARDAGKQVELVVLGGETEVDRQVLEAMKAPLTHLLRNAVSHGIEPPAQRVAAGKPPTGRISLMAKRQGGNVTIEVSDDGAGIDSAKISERAVRNGLLEPQAAEGLDWQACVGLLFSSGFSTAEQVGEISGRGVGLDAVKEGVEKLNGLIEVDSEIGGGTKFNLVLPLTLATVKVLLLRTGGTTLAIPAASVERIHRLDHSQVGSIEGKPVINAGGSNLPLYSLASVLELPGGGQAGREGGVLAVVVGIAEQRAAFSVDEVLGTHEVVIQGLGTQMKNVRNVAGATIMGNGQVVVIINVADILASSRSMAGVHAAVEAERGQRKRPRLLVVDDSITTRTLEKNILETAGYRVQVASDGEEAWALLQNQAFNLVVSDVSMPRLDGIGLTKRIKKDQRLKRLPVVLVTSLESEEDKIRGLESGAESYITKTDFDQGQLLETIERLLG